MEIVFNKLSYIENKGSSMEKKYLDDVNMVINQGSIIGVTTSDLDILGKLLMVVKRPTSGELILNNVVIKRTSHVNNVVELRKNIGFFGLDTYFTFDNVKDEIKNTMKNYGYKTDNVLKHIVDSLKIVGLSEDYVDREIKTLSYTEKKKVKLASILSYNPEVLVINSFEKGLIERERNYFKKLFLKLKNKFNKTIIILSDDLTFMFDLVQKVYVINKGKLVLSGDTDVFYDKKLYKYTEMPKIVEFTMYAHDCGYDILEYTDIKELLKELYRNVK